MDEGGVLAQEPVFFGTVWSGEAFNTVILQTVVVWCSIVVYNTLQLLVQGAFPPVAPNHLNLLLSELFCIFPK